MKIVIVSDTHMPRKGRELPEALIEDLKSSDLIIHGGIFKQSKCIRNLWFTGN